MKTTDPKTVYSWHTKLALWIDPDKKENERKENEANAMRVAVLFQLTRENQRLHNQRIALIVIIYCLIVLTIMAIRNCVK